MTEAIFVPGIPFLVGIAVLLVIWSTRKGWGGDVGRFVKARNRANTIIIAGILFHLSAEVLVSEGLATHMWLESGAHAVMLIGFVYMWKLMSQLSRLSRQYSFKQMTMAPIGAGALLANQLAVVTAGLAALVGFFITARFWSAFSKLNKGPYRALVGTELVYVAFLTLAMATMVVHHLFTADLELLEFYEMFWNVLVTVALSTALAGAILESQLKVAFPSRKKRR